MALFYTYPDYTPKYVKPKAFGISTIYQVPENPQNLSCYYRSPNRTKTTPLMSGKFERAINYDIDYKN
jgi:hypothetical protein